MKVWKTIATVIPGPAVLFIGKWLDLFSETHLTYPNWQLGAERIAIGASAVVAILLSILLSGVSKEALKGWTWAGFALTILGLAGCWGIWFHLGPSMPAADAVWWQDVWQGLYIVTMVLLVATVTLAAMTLQEDKPKTFWWIFVAIIVALLATAAIVFWWR